MMTQQARTFRTLIIFAIVVVLGAFVVSRFMKGGGAAATNDARSQLAQCLTDKGVKMYGAYWCPHCQAQKKQFGDAFKKVTYVECAIPGDSRGQTQACKDQNIEGYPTWIFQDGSRVSGEQTFETLAEKSGCTYDETPEADPNAPTY
jgi:hypothetical protein